jgi:hypothetical protein
MSTSDRSFDPLFRETPLSSALRAELSIPEGTELQYLRFTGEGVRFPPIVVPPEGLRRPQPPRQGRSLHGYEWVFVVSADAAASAWGPGVQGFRVWLGRIRYGQDLAYGEVQPVPGEEPYYRLHEEGPVTAIDRGAGDRARYGLKFLFGESAVVGRHHDPVQAQGLAAQRQKRLLDALEERYRLGTPEAEITLKLLAGDLHESYRTLRYWRASGKLDLDALKAEARQRARLPRP